MPNHADFANTLSLSFALVLVVSTAIKLWLNARQVRHVLANRAKVPDAFASRISLSAHQKAADYTVARMKLSSISTVVGAVVLLGWTLLGGLDALNTWVRDGIAPRFGDMAHQIALIVGLSAIGGLIDLPESLYSTFVLEERFGFNKTTLKLWVVDGIKGMLVGALLGLPLVVLILWIMGTGGSWWLIAWGVFVGFQMLVMVVYPTVIAPLFNTFKPLADEGLRDRVQGLMARCGFKAKGLFVMDGSKRSAHGNAYFTGLGSAKRVVFFDTLLERLTHQEVEAVLAHELGHFHHKHIVKRMALMVVVSLAFFALLGTLAQQTWFYEGLGVSPNLNASNNALALTLFVMALPSFTFLITPWLSKLSRNDEYEADRYARAQTNGQDLGSALLKLYEDNAGTLTPDPLYVAFHASHPPASQRLAALGLARAL
jgi:STE24 endopeptidase